MWRSTIDEFEGVKKIDMQTKKTVRFYSCVLTCFLLMQGVGNVSAQTGSVTLSGTYMTVGKAMAEIQAQSPYVFAFNRQFDTGKAVRFPKRTITIKDAVDQMLADVNCNAMIHNNYIAIVPGGNLSERANPAVSRWENSLTGDRYQKSDLHTLNAEATVYEKRREGHSDTIHTETLVSAVPVEHGYPASYSDYRPAGGFLSSATRLPKVAIKTNLLYAGLLFTPNLSVEVATAERQTFELSGSYLWWGRKNDASENHKQFTHWIIRPEYRWWLCRRFDGHYFGAHALYGRYFISGREIPLLFKKEYSYDGHAVGAGATYGYHWAIGRRVGLEFNIGLGYVYLWHDRGSCFNCDWQMEAKNKHYFGPTRAGINLVVMLW